VPAVLAGTRLEGDTSMHRLARVPCAVQPGSQTQDQVVSGIPEVGEDGCEQRARGPVPDLVPVLVLVPDRVRSRGHGSRSVTA
jgi:hypothetical protein